MAVIFTRKYSHAVFVSRKIGAFFLCSGVSHLPRHPSMSGFLCANVSSMVLCSQLLSSKQGGPQAWGGSSCCSPTPQTPEAHAQVNRTALSLHLTGTPSVGELIRKRAQGFLKFGWACPKVGETGPESLWVAGHEQDCCQLNKVESWGIIWVMWVLMGSRKLWGISLRFKTTEIIN